MRFSLKRLERLPRFIESALLTGLLGVAHILMPSCAFAQAAIQAQPNDDLLYISAKEIKNYFDFPGAPLKQIVRVNVEYQQTEGQSYGEKRQYEELWYDGQRPLGQRRFRDFDLRQRDPIYIYAEASTPAEISALANALIRVFLDASFNRNSIIGILLPASSFGPLTDQLETEYFYRPGRFNGRPQVYITLPLLSDDGKKLSAVYYPPNSQ